MFWAKVFNKRVATLGDILSKKENQEMLLGIKNVFQDRNSEQDAAQIAAYSRSPAYTEWAREAWGQILFDLDKLTRNNISEREASFHRGSLAATCDLLRLSYKAQEKVKESKDAVR